MRRLLLHCWVRRSRRQPRLMEDILPADATVILDCIETLSFVWHFGRIAQIQHVLGESRLMEQVVVAASKYQRFQAEKSSFISGFSALRRFRTYASSLTLCKSASWLPAREKNRHPSNSDCRSVSRFAEQAGARQAAEQGGTRPQPFQMSAQSADCAPCGWPQPHGAAAAAVLAKRRVKKAS